ncbi:hypothetical protein DL240_04575 [Lujinxingia litoralis]|uniref:Uncharacterized protein n=1 Tax=Lujinxingia litoralis TaxID=2211119 RepID=A0A328CDK3_9DELT|nr:SRPBCC family protein [Lujinxingia litoralis]RAL25491.1 hypothetical protein DL240_04575 [Lujinxingia litoralis]
MSSRDQRSDTAHALSALSRDPGARERDQSDTLNPLPLVSGALLTAYGLKRRGTLGYLLAGIGAGILYQGLKSNDLLDGNLPRRLLHLGATQMAPIHHTTVVKRSPEEVYAFWRELENLAVYLPRIYDIEVLDEQHSRWYFRAPGERTLSTEVEILEDQPDRLIVWRSMEPNDISHEGWVAFTPLDEGASTEVDLHLRVLAPGGQLGARILEMLGRFGPLSPAPELARVREVLEAGIPDRVEAASSTLH